MSPEISLSNVLPVIKARLSARNTLFMPSGKVHKAARSLKFGRKMLVFPRFSQSMYKYALESCMLNLLQGLFFPGLPLGQKAPVLIHQTVGAPYHKGRQS